MAYRVKISSALGDETVLVTNDQALAAAIEALELLNYQNLDDVIGITIDPQ